MRIIKRLTSIVAIDLAGAIGCDNTLPWRLRTDMAFFRAQTLGNSVIMGRKTFDSLGSNPLPKRNNIVLSHNAVLFESGPHCKLAQSVDETLYVASQFDDDEVFVIGGAQTYSQFDAIVDRYLLTVVDHQVPDADAFLSQPVLTSMRDWDRKEVGQYEAVIDQDEFAFSIFEIVAPDPVERRTNRETRTRSFADKVTPNKKIRAPRKTASVAPQDAFAF